MKNNKLLYLLTILITLFSFNINVYALTCKYDNKILIQSDSGERFLHIQIDEFNVSAIKSTEVWNENDKGKGMTFVKYYWDELETKENANAESGLVLTSCPAGIMITGSDGVYEETIHFYSEEIPEEVKGEIEQVIEKVSEQVARTGPIEVSDPLNDNLIVEEKSPFTGQQYTGGCKYQLTNNNDKINIIDVKIAKNELLFSEYSPNKGFVYSGIYASETRDGQYINHRFDIETDYVLKEFFEEYKGSCPPLLKVVVTSAQGEGALESTNITDNFKSYKTFVLSKTEGKNPITGEEFRSAEEIFNEQVNIIGGQFATIQKCEDLFSGEKGENLLKLIKFIVSLINIGIPILLIGLGVFDFVQIVFTGADDKIKKTQTKFINRLIIGGCIYLIPSILKAFLEIASSIWPNISADFCGIL